MHLTTNDKNKLFNYCFEDTASRSNDIAKNISGTVIPWDLGPALATVLYGM